ncbi:MAG TPA: TlpA disulfide reductase family protein [Iamia sp.]|nr:TlpA disulfide reductase family protein [Iamia sp.]
MSHKPTKGRPLAQSRVEAARNGPRVPVFALAVGGLVLVLVIAAVVVAVVGGEKGGTLGEGEQAFGPVTATGTPLETYSPSGEDPAVGEPAPKLEGESATGEAVTVDPAEGPMVVVFLAHWCSHCQAEVPRIVAVADGADEIEGVPFTAVLTGSEAQADNFPPGDWLEREDWPAPAMVDSEPEAGSVPVALNAYGLKGYPFMVAIDGDGNVAARHSGELGEDGIREFFAQVAE